MKYAIGIYFWCHCLTSPDFITLESAPSSQCECSKGRFQARKATSGPCARVEKRSWLWDAKGQQCQVSTPTSRFALASSSCRCIRWPSSTRANFSPTLNSELFACFRSFKKPWNRIFPWPLRLRLSRSSSCLTCKPMSAFWSNEDQCHPYQYHGISLLPQAVIKCTMSWHIVQLGREEPAWKLHSLHCVVRPSLKMNTAMYLLSTVHSKATARVREKRLFTDHWWHKNRAWLSERSFYSIPPQRAQANESNQLQHHCPSQQQKKVPCRHISD